jgi:hypothetical protein
VKTLFKLETQCIHSAWKRTGSFFINLKLDDMNLIIVLFLLLLNNVNAQVLVMDIQDTLSTVQIKHQEEFQYGELDEKHMYRDRGLFEIDFEDGQIYNLIINSEYYITFRPSFYDDVLTTSDEVEMICKCVYEVVDNKLQITF